MKFFRKIRERFLAQNKFTKYLLYAIGEIVLVVIGILIALAVNTKMEKVKNQETAVKTLRNLYDDIKEDMQQLDNYWIPELKQQNEARNRLEAFLNKDMPIEDTLQFLNEIVLISIYATFDQNKTATENLINTGGIDLIDDNQLRSMLLIYKRQSENINEFDALHRAFFLELFGRIGPKIVDGIAYSQSFKFYYKIDTIKPRLLEKKALNSENIRSSGYLKEFLGATAPPFYIKQAKYIELRALAKDLLNLIDASLRKNE